jgi:cytochrome P450
MVARGAFGQFFKIENLNKLTPDIVKVVESHFKNIRDSQFLGEDKDWKKLDIGEMFCDVFSKVVQQILFDEQLAKIEGKHDLPTAIADYVNLSSRAGFSISNLLSFELMNKFGLGKLCSTIDAMYAQITDTCWEQYNLRLKSGPKSGVNMLDLLISQQKSGEITWTKDEIVGNFILLQFAGADTSRTISQTLTYYLSDKPDF